MYWGWLAIVPDGAQAGSGGSIWLSSGDGARVRPTLTPLGNDGHQNLLPSDLRCASARCRHLVSGHQLQCRVRFLARLSALWSCPPCGSRTKSSANRGRRSARSRRSACRLFLARTHDRTSGTWPLHDGSGDFTVRAQIHAIGVALVPSATVTSGSTCRFVPWPRAHPLAVGLDVSCETPGSFPDRLRTAGVGMDRRLTSESVRDLEHRPLDQDCDRIEVTGESRQPEPQGLQRDRTTAAERVENRWADRRRRTLDLGRASARMRSIVRVPPTATSRSRMSKSRLRSRLLLLLGREPLRVCRRVVDERGPDHRSSRGERSTGPPQVERRMGDRAGSTSLGRRLALIAASGSATSMSFVL